MANTEANTERGRDFWGFVKGSVVGTVLGEAAMEALFAVADDRGRASRLEVLPVVTVACKGVRLANVVHSHWTLIDHREQIEQLVERSPLVVLEYFEQEDRDRALPGMRIEETLSDNVSLNDTTGAFFSGIGRICAEAGKDVVVVNPESAWNQLLELYLGLGTLGGGLAQAAGNGREAIKRRGVTRRDFLELLLLLPGIGVMNSWLRLFQRLDTEEAGRSRDTWAWYLPDYRDLKTAQGVETVVRTFEHEIGAGDEVAVIQGTAHGGGVLGYLREPGVRQAKLWTYPHYQLMDRDMIRRYRFDVGANEWRLIQTLPYYMVE